MDNAPDLLANVTAAESKRAAEFVGQLQRLGGKLEPLDRRFLGGELPADLTLNPVPTQFAHVNKEYAEFLWTESLRLGLNYQQATENVHLQLIMEDAQYLKHIEREVRPEQLNPQERRAMAELGDPRYLQTHIRENFIAKCGNKYETGALTELLVNRIENAQDGTSAHDRAVEMYEAYTGFNQEVHDRALADAPFLEQGQHVARGQVVQLNDVLIGRGEVIEIDLETQQLKEWEIGEKIEFEVPKDMIWSTTEQQKNAEAVKKAEIEKASAPTKFHIRRPQKIVRQVIDRAGHQNLQVHDVVHPSAPINEKIADMWDDPVVQEFKKAVEELPEPVIEMETYEQKVEQAMKDLSGIRLLNRLADLRREAERALDVSLNSDSNPMEEPLSERKDRAEKVEAKKMEMGRRGKHIKGRK